MGENDLARFAQQGNREAFEILCEQIISKIFRYFSHRLHDKEVCEDLTSETMWKILNAFPKWSGNENFSAWMFTIAKYTFYDFLREKYKNPEMNFSQIGEEIENFAISEELIRNEQLDIEKETLLENLLGVLPEKHQSVLRLRYLLGYTAEETAQELGLSLANVKVIQHRALQKVRDYHPDFSYPFEKV